jgi:hypothetical protein
MNETGYAVQQFLTTNPGMFEEFAGYDLHGGPPLVSMTSPTPHYLGIFHYFVELPGHMKSYHHYFYR